MNNALVNLFFSTHNIKQLRYFRPNEEHQNFHGKMSQFRIRHKIFYQFCLNDSFVSLVTLDVIHFKSPYYVVMSL